MRKACKKISRSLDRYFDGMVAEEERAVIEDHIARCQFCKDALFSVNKLRNLLRVQGSDYPSEADFNLVWQKIAREIHVARKPFRLKFLPPLPDIAFLFRKRVWIPAAVAGLVILAIVTFPFFKEPPFLPKHFGVQYIESSTNDVMVYEIEAAKVSVIWILEEQEGESTSSLEQVLS